MTIITGRIIRIVDKQTFILNLGREDGITDSSIFRVYAKPEQIIDPENKNELGKVIIVKARMKASQVFDKFTIASSKWKEIQSTYLPYSMSYLANVIGESIEVGEEDLRVRKEEIQPWKAKSEEYIQIGDTVEVEITEKEQIESGENNEDNTDG